jgi:hypothetical protein
VYDQILLFSILDTKVRLIQAHMCPAQRRLKVSSSQLFEFGDCSQETMDLFVRWLLCDPVGTTTIMGDEVTPAPHPSVNVAPQTKLASPTDLSTGRSIETFKSHGLDLNSAKLDSERLVCLGV